MIDDAKNGAKFAVFKAAAFANAPVIIGFFKSAIILSTAVFNRGSMVATELVSTALALKGGAYPAGICVSARSAAELIAENTDMAAVATPLDEAAWDGLE